MLGHDLEQGDGAAEVVVVVAQRLVHALAHRLEARKVDAAVKPVRESSVHQSLVHEKNHQRLLLPLLPW